MFGIALSFCACGQVCVHIWGAAGAGFRAGAGVGSLTRVSVGAELAGGGWHSCAHKTRAHIMSREYMHNLAQCRP